MRGRALAPGINLPLCGGSEPAPDTAGPGGQRGERGRKKEQEEMLLQGGEGAMPSPALPPGPPAPTMAPLLLRAPGALQERGKEGNAALEQWHH